MQIMKITIMKENLYTALEFRIFLDPWHQLCKENNASVLKISQGSNR